MSALDVPEEHDTLDGVPSPALARRVVGQDSAWRDLADAADGDRMHHAWLLQGPRGIGKATTAFAFARRLLGYRPDDASPAIEAVDRQIAQGSHPGLFHLTRPAADRSAGFKTQITVEEIRRLHRFFQSTAATGAWRVAIVDPIDDLNRNAANALLKLLEEPPARALFLIANHVPGRILPTIRSRCRVLGFAPLAAAPLRQILADLLPSALPSEIDPAIAMAEGSARTAVALLTGGGLDIEARIDAVWDRDEPDWFAIQSICDALTQKGRESAFDLALAGLQRRLARDAEAAVGFNEMRLARDLATLWAEEGARMREGLAYNLDRKQILVTHFAKLFEAKSASRRSGGHGAEFD